MDNIIKKDITLVRGNTKVLDIKIKNLPADVVIDKIYFTVKKCANDKEAVLQKYLNNRYRVNRRNRRV